MTDPARIQRIAEDVRRGVQQLREMLPESARPIFVAAHIDGLGEAVAMLITEIAASQAVATPEPVVVEWADTTEDNAGSQAMTGSLTLSVWPTEFPKDIIGWVWDVTLGEQLIARSGIRGIQSDRDAAKAAAIAAARAWRDSIRL